MSVSHIELASSLHAQPGITPAATDDKLHLPYSSRAFHYAPRKLIHCPETDCVRRLLPSGIIAAAELRAIEINTSADRVLIAQGWVSAEQYTKALASSLGCGYDPLLQIPRAICLGDDEELIESTKTGILWVVARQRRILVVAPEHINTRRLVWCLKLRPHLSADICLTTSQGLFEFVSRHTRQTIAGKAALELKATQPEFSAGVARSRLSILPIIGSLVILAAIIFAPGLTITVIDIALALIFLGWTALRVIGALTTDLMWRRHRPVPDNELPVYSLVVALYREAASVRGLVESLGALDYPQEKLDIKLVLEPDDHETRLALTKLKLGANFTIVTAPGFGPRTKPKALNAALPFVRGSYVAVFDAEDRPEPNQLRKAMQVFQAGSRKLACVQARLTIDNSNDSWLTRMFTAEYAGLFDVFLPGLAAWHLPLPLGGSSNHFRTSILRAAGAWDPYNVTEDADLGMRLARLGYHTAVFDSTTYEEAPVHFLPWLKQRTRWFKGWIQTWLVHMRQPMRLLHDLKLSGFIVFQLVIGGTVLAAMVHGVFMVAFGWQIASGWLWAEKSSISDILVVGLHATTLVTGYFISSLLALIGLARRQLMTCAWALLLMPLYWLLLSVAAWRALFHFILEPYAWEKTEHGLARTSRLESR